jgi:dihydrolipoamide dehydrogenase
LIAEGAFAVEMGALVWDLALTVHSHPTLSETVAEAAEACVGKAIHLVPQQVRA